MNKHINRIWLGIKLLFPLWLIGGAIIFGIFPVFLVGYFDNNFSWLWLYVIHIFALFYSMGIDEETP